MSDDHIFRASGDSCPICLAMDGEKVAAGYTAHEGCQCQTVAVSDHSDCEWTLESMDGTRDGPGAYDKVFGFEVTVKCPDGSVFGASGEFDGHPYSARNTDFDEILDLFHDAAEDLAQELCDGCASAKDSDFRCC